MGFTNCFLYLSALGLVFHFIGEALPRRWFDCARFPYAAFSWERDGLIYEKLAVRRWKNRIPDMSLRFHDMFPKRLSRETKKDDFPRLIEETCVAEFVHYLLSVLGLACAALWPGAGGLVMILIWIFAGNLPYIIIQRYNRPRLIRAYAKISNK